MDGDHPDTLETMTELAAVYNYEKRYAEAEALYRPAIEKLRRVLGEENSVTLKNIVFLADVYAAQHRFAEAEALHRDTRARLRRLLGDDHPLTIQATNNLASLYADEGRTALCGCRVKSSCHSNSELPGPVPPAPGGDRISNGPGREPLVTAILKSPDRPMIRCAKRQGCHLILSSDLQFSTELSCSHPHCARPAGARPCRRRGRRCPPPRCR